MRKPARLMVGALLAVVALPAVAAPQQRHAIDPAALAATVTRHITGQDQQRAALRTALAQPDVRELAVKMGVDLERVSAAVGTMSSDNLAAAAAIAGKINQPLVGGRAASSWAVPALIVGGLVAVIVYVVNDYPKTCATADCYRR